MARQIPIRTVTLAALVVISGFAPAGRSDAADPRRLPPEAGAPVIQVVGSEESSRFVPLRYRQVGRA
ncbi:MAG: hypothetical protein M5U33_06825 [Pseudorhodoplanes sp.]|nr:hypothetical protein [Pseudorhodoplanes sp.]